MKLRDDTGRLWETFITRDNESIAPSSLTCDGTEASLPSLSIEADGGTPFRLIVAGQILPAHVAKSGDEWWIHIDGRTHMLRAADSGSRRKSASAEGSLTAPMPGTIVEVLVTEGSSVEDGDPLIVMEAMKMEHRLYAPFAGEIEAVHFQTGDKVERGIILIDIKKTQLEN